MARAMVLINMQIIPKRGCEEILLMLKPEDEKEEKERDFLSISNTFSPVSYQNKNTDSSIILSYFFASIYALYL